MNIKIKKINPNAKTPFRATSGSAGADLFAEIEADIIIKPAERKLIPTGLIIEIPDGYGGFVFPRSSLASKHGISLSNCVGVIDSDYRGEVKIPLINHGEEDFAVKPGDRVAQLVVLPVCQAVFVHDDELTETNRGMGGFGSTGKS
jgi:dUTP pyrophosphatase